MQRSIVKHCRPFVRQVECFIGIPSCFWQITTLHTVHLNFGRSEHRNCDIAKSSLLGFAVQKACFGEYLISKPAWGASFSYILLPLRLEGRVSGLRTQFSPIFLMSKLDRRGGVCQILQVGSPEDKVHPWLMMKHRRIFRKLLEQETFVLSEMLVSLVYWFSIHRTQTLLKLNLHKQLFLLIELCNETQSVRRTAKYLPPQVC